MARREFVWTTYSEPVSESRIAEVQARLGVRFPEAFLDWVRHHNGGYPEPGCFAFLNTATGEMDEGGIGALLDFRESMDKYLKQIYRNDPDLWKDMDIQPWWTIEDENLDDRVDHFTPGLIAFAEDGGGNYLCFDYRGGKDNPDPPIVLWHHEFHSGGEEPFFVAKNFDALVDLLRPSSFVLPDELR
jgi:hypothetical protein